MPVAYIDRSSGSTQRCDSSGTTNVSLPPSFDAEPDVLARTSPPFGKYTADADWYLRTPPMPANTSGCSSGPHSPSTKAAFSNVLPACDSSVARHLINGE